MFRFQVNINQFGDSRTRLYSIWGVCISNSSRHYKSFVNIGLLYKRELIFLRNTQQATNGVMHGCYNTDCPGFVQIDKTITLGMIFDQVSVPGGTQYFVNLGVQLVSSTGKQLVPLRSSNSNRLPNTEHV